MSNKNLKELEKNIGYTFNDGELLRHAMTHSSFISEHRLNKLACNERLEFLGDAVLEIVVSEYLFTSFSQMPEGEMTRNRASIVCEPTLALCSRDICLGDYLLLGKGEDQTGGRMRDSVTSDAMEALIGAIYLDGGFTNAKEFIYRFILKDISAKQLFYDSKSILQEMVQTQNNKKLSYEMVSESGPDHNKKFEVRALVDGIEVGHGIGRTKKAAQQQAAYNAILAIRAQNNETRNN
jgi:ribonuclease-3